MPKIESDKVSFLSFQTMPLKPQYAPLEAEMAFSAGVEVAAMKQMGVPEKNVMVLTCFERHKSLLGYGEGCAARDGPSVWGKYISMRALYVNTYGPV